MLHLHLPNNSPLFIFYMPMTLLNCTPNLVNTIWRGKKKNSVVSHCSGAKRGHLECGLQGPAGSQPSPLGHLSRYSHPCSTLQPHWSNCWNPPSKFSSSRVLPLTHSYLSLQSPLQWPFSKKTVPEPQTQGHQCPVFHSSQIVFLVAIYCLVAQVDCELQ